VWPPYEDGDYNPPAELERYVCDYDGLYAHGLGITLEG